MTNNVLQRERRMIPYLWVSGIAALFVLLIIGIHRESPRTLISFHGLLHAAIAGQFTEQMPTSFPPENPFFAGRPLCYYWFYHCLAAQLVRLFGMNIFHAFEALIGHPGPATFQQHADRCFHCLSDHSRN
jgi:uncharacterized membrane protein